MLPKSLHTVRILTAVARAVAFSGDVGCINAVLEAARVLGYPDASPADPLIAKAAAVLAKSVQS